MYWRYRALWPLLIYRIVRMLILASAVIIAFALFFWCYVHEALSPAPSGLIGGERSALVVDAVGVRAPDLLAIVDLLRRAGFDVTVKRLGDVTVRFLDGFGGYDLVVIFAHGSINDGHLYVFSFERYAWNKYVFEQLSRSYVKGVVLESSFFALRGDLIGGDISGSTLVLATCNGSTPKTISALLDRGAKEVVTFNGSVSPNLASKLVLLLLRHAFERGLSFNEAVQQVNRLAADQSLNVGLVYASKS